MFGKVRDEIRGELLIFSFEGVNENIKLDYSVSILSCNSFKNSPVR
jgi:hypothetical protein